MNLADQSSLPGVEGPMLAEFAREERARAALGVVLPHLVSADDAPVLGEEAVVRTRALLSALAADLLGGLGEAGLVDNHVALVAELAGRPLLLAHCHALVLEGQAAERLAARGLDPVLSPAFETWLAADRDTAALAMTALTAQARFTCRQRRMEAVAAELPAEAMHEALLALGAVAGEAGEAAATELRAHYDESRTRLALLARLALATDDPAAPLLDPQAAGLALFATALAQRAGVAREEAVLAAAVGQELRLGLLLRAAGVAPGPAQAAMAVVHPDAELPQPWAELAEDRAAALLAGDDEGAGA
jgi:hypothetical protein